MKKEEIIEELEHNREINKKNNIINTVDIDYMIERLEDIQELDNIEMIVSTEDLQKNQRRTLRKEQERKEKKAKKKERAKKVITIILLFINFVAFVLCGFNSETFICGYIFLFNSIIIYTYWVINFGILEEEEE